MAEEFVRRDVFDATIQRIDQRFDSLEKRMDERFAAMEDKMEQRFALMEERMERNLAEYKAIALETRGEVRALAAHIDSLEFWGAIIVGAATIFFGVAQYFQSKRETIASEVKEQVLELRRTVLGLVEAEKIAAAR